MSPLALLLWAAPILLEPTTTTTSATIAPALPAIAPRVFAHGSRDSNRVALTFDACTRAPRLAYDPRITQILRDTGTPATIFVGGNWARSYPESLEEVRQLPGVELANHSMFHRHMISLHRELIRQEIMGAQNEIFRLTGETPRLFRPPFGEYDRKVVEVAASLGLVTVEYDLPSGDPAPKLTKNQLVRWVLKRTKPGSIVVMHINHPKFKTAEALPEIIQGLRDRGFELVTVGTLLEGDTP